MAFFLAGRVLPSYPFFSSPQSNSSTKNRKLKEGKSTYPTHTWHHRCPRNPIQNARSKGTPWMALLRIYLPIRSHKRDSVPWLRPRTLLASLSLSLLEACMVLLRKGCPGGVNNGGGSRKYLLSEGLKSMRVHLTVRGIINDLRYISVQFFGHMATHSNIRQNWFVRKAFSYSSKTSTCRSLPSLSNTTTDWQYHTHTTVKPFKFNNRISSSFRKFHSHITFLDVWTLT